MTMHSLSILGLTADKESLLRIFTDFYQKKICTKGDLKYLAKNYGYFNKKDEARFEAIIRNAQAKGYFNQPKLLNISFMGSSFNKQQEKKARAQARVEERKIKKHAEEVEKNQRFIKEHMPTVFNFGFKEAEN
jgi:hypothetical protein